MWHTLILHSCQRTFLNDSHWHLSPSHLEESEDENFYERVTDSGGCNQRSSQGKVQARLQFLKVPLTLCASKSPSPTLYSHWYVFSSLEKFTNGFCVSSTPAFPSDVSPFCGRSWGAGDGPCRVAEMYNWDMMEQCGVCLTAGHVGRESLVLIRAEAACGVGLVQWQETCSQDCSGLIGRTDLPGLCVPG